MKHNFNPILLFIALNFPIILNSQSSSCEECGKALTYSQDVFVYNDYSSVLFKLHEIYNEEESTYNYRRRQEGGNIHSYEYGTAEYYNEKKRINDLKRLYYKNKNILSKTETKKFISKRIGNPRAFESFDKCIEACNSVEYSVVIPRIESNVEFTIKVFPKSPGESEIKVKQIVLKNCFFEVNELTNGQKLSTNQPFISRLKKGPNSDARVDIIFEGEAGRINEIHIPSPQPKLIGRKVNLEPHFLSDIQPLAYTSERKVLNDILPDKKPINIQGRDYDKGIWMHPKDNEPFYVEYSVPDYYPYFNVVFGQAHYGKDKDLVQEFTGKIIIDGEELKSIKINDRNRSERISLEVPRYAKTLKLVIEPNGSSKNDHCVWADAHFGENRKY